MDYLKNLIQYKCIQICRQKILILVTKKSIAKQSNINLSIKSMQAQKQNALIIREFKKPPVYQKFDIPQAGPNQVQIKMVVSTINPSDRIMIEGGYWRTEPNFIGGLEGVGQVIKAGGPEGEHLVGKRVCFNTSYGTWAEYSVANIENVWPVTEDVPIESAASGVINPITVIGFIDTYRKWSNKGATPKGIINTAAASALGRMLNKICQTEKIPLLNIVRRKEQVEILQKEGAKHIINTSDADWVDQYKEAIKTDGFNVLFDAIAGGEITDKLISNLPPFGQAFLYGKLSSENLTISKPLIFTGGVLVTSWLIFDWMPSLTKEEVQSVQQRLPGLLKNELATSSIKQIKLAEVPEEVKNSEKNATDGKFTIII